ncbi:hypothetical protein DTO013E5_6693 [Penicillium roqueforti]|uniref:Genomic scaffold, ProqFM164S04 n=1 Tax=Penicillium roqueforti (strain FM164) TaxID=1365484 RepID=W6QM57_PENRF|nr:hypothetical protein CBS147337_4843 [Penicillium roqueforti]CDM35259.1 unnamed protein product [Penicillium roqueforti FM164]KAI2685921.1 hypothetical protein CBS147355_1408 [Penicillium roqueforti]KAI2692125.1 hypothetical protein LCP963914a_219 [Penicillium roqueforti]KAI2717960.1 hypothetical protein CBS147318_4537 [Penicillium roqueforti]
MAAPREITIECLNGRWVLNKDLTSEADPILKLQKVPWLLRKAFEFATIYIQISQYQTPASETSQPSTSIDFTQTATAGLAATKEERVLDWKVLDHEDYFFGEVKAQSEFVHGVIDAGGIIRPEFELQTAMSNDQIKQYLRGEIQEDGSKSTGFLVEDWSGMSEEGPGLWVHTFERNVKSGWTAEQIWGFEMFGDSRYFSRRGVIMTTRGEYMCGRIVFDFVST